MGSLRGLRVGSEKTDVNRVEVHDSAIYYGIFDSFEKVMSEFNVPEEEVARLKSGGEILLATYDYEDYSGDAYVLYRDGTKYYEVYGSHCS
jgi:hypothetical protein